MEESRNSAVLLEDSSHMQLASQQQAELALSSKGLELLMAVPGTLFLNTPPPSPASPDAIAVERSNAVPQVIVVSEVKVGCTLDLMTIARKAKNTMYNPRKSPLVIMHLREPKTTAFISKSGKFWCTGAKSKDQSRLAARKFTRILQELSFPARFLQCNTYFRGDVGFPIALEILQLKHHSSCRYEPELGFPGLIYNMERLKCTLQIFQSGKVIIGGQSCGEMVDKAFIKILPVLRDCEKKTSARNNDTNSDMGQ